MNYFVTGIDTDSGKTLVSAILCEALKADYWKPVQAGLPLDRETVKSLVTDSSVTFHDEQYFLKFPASPHASAKLEDIRIEKLAGVSVRFPNADPDSTSPWNKEAFEDDRHDGSPKDKLALLHAEGFGYC